MDENAVRDHFRDQVYGIAPTEPPVQLSWEALEQGDAPGNGRRRQLRLDLTGPDGTSARITLLVHLPDGATADAPVPAFCGMNFRGNHVCADDPEILDLAPGGDAPESAGDRLHYEGPRDVKDPAPGRGAQQNRWPFDLVTDRGHASVTWCYLQLGPEGPGVHELPAHRIFSQRPSEQREPQEWGAIGIWAWSMSRVLDALAAGMVPEIDPTRVIAHGHSRLGKTALWAGACDERFAMVVSNNSGCLGAALSRNVGETPQKLDRIRPYWFAPNFHHVSERWLATYDGADDPDLPDQPDLLRLIAPRPLYVASASEDLNADPEGEYLSWQQASAAWDGGPEATAGAFPAPGTVLAPDGAPLGYHLREGKHDVFEFDWKAWLDFSDRWV